MESISKTSICIPDPDEPLLTTDVPTIIGVGVGLSVFSALTCLVLKLFSRARFSPARAYGDANLAPPSPLPENRHVHRSSYNRQTSFTDSESQLGIESKRRTSSINGVISRSSGSFYDRRQSLHSLAHAEKHSKAREANSNQPDNAVKPVAANEGVDRDTQVEATELHPLNPGPNETSIVEH